MRGAIAAAHETRNETYDSTYMKKQLPQQVSSNQTGSFDFTRRGKLNDWPFGATIPDIKY